MALFHQPFGRAGGSTDAYRLDTLKPLRIDFFWTLYQMTVSIDTQTLIKEYFAI